MSRIYQTRNSAKRHRTVILQQDVSSVKMNLLSQVKEVADTSDSEDEEDTPAANAASIVTTAVAVEAPAAIVQKRTRLPQIFSHQIFNEVPASVEPAAIGWGVPSLPNAPTGMVPAFNSAFERVVRWQQFMWGPSAYCHNFVKSFNVPGHKYNTDQQGKCYHYSVCKAKSRFVCAQCSQWTSRVVYVCVNCHNGLHRQTMPMSVLQTAYAEDNV